jgi:ribosomal protein S18 acetylase RimI-like enzyme
VTRARPPRPPHPPVGASDQLRLVVERLNAFKPGELDDLCEATDSAIEDGGGFGWVNPPPRDTLEAYWRGVMLVPERSLFVARLDGTICGSAQFLRPSRNNEAQAFVAQLQSAFVAPWARGHGLARMLTVAIEEEARRAGYTVLTLDVRETQERAIAHYKSLGYVRWGTNPFYARIGGKYMAGHCYYKTLDAGLTTGVATGRTDGAAAGVAKP